MLYARKVENLRVEDEGKERRLCLMSFDHKINQLNWEEFRYLSLANLSLDLISASYRK